MLYESIVPVPAFTSVSVTALSLSDSPQDLDRAARLLREGALVAFPTETVYGLGGDAGNDHACAAIFAAKGRPRFNPLIIHLAEADDGHGLALFDERAERLAARFWPGPLTLVLKRRPGCQISLLASAGLDTLALRQPAHPVARRLLAATGRPVAAPSANRSGRVSPTMAAHVIEELGDRIAAVVDGGPCLVGVESTILDLSGGDPVLLRPGGVTREMLESLIGPVEAPARAEGGAPRAPGMLESHYAPSLPLRLNAERMLPGEALLAFGPNPPQGYAAISWLSRSGDLAEAAANLFAALRALDRPDFTGIAVAPIPESGIGAAINDRLRRAAAPRPSSEKRHPLPEKEQKA